MAAPVSQSGRGRLALDVDVDPVSGRRARAGRGVAADPVLSAHDWTFLLDSGFALGLNSVLLAYLMYTSGLVPRFIALELGPS